MVTKLRSPNSPKVLDVSNTTYSLHSDGYGVAVLSGGSGLSNGDTILIYNSLTTYNGFFLLSSYGPGAFRLMSISISEYTGLNFLEYAQDHDNIPILPPALAAYLKYSCVHLPIVYKLSSNLWPVNSSDTIRTVTGFANDNSYVKLTLSGSIDLQELDWLNIQATSEDELDGPFQIITKYSNTQYTINAPYSLAAGSPYTYASATAQKYYNNYRALVRIYAGLEPTHAWAALKPYTLITTLRLQPDIDNNIFVNVADSIKQKIKVLENRPNYDSMPYDLDRFCKFYIEYAEGYDDSDGIEVENFISSFQSDFDFFQGVAVDAKLEFKNRYSGMLNDYVIGTSDTDLPLFLSPTSKRFDLPVAIGGSCQQRATIFPGWYFDLSLIKLTGTTIPVQVIGYDENDNETFIDGFNYTGLASDGVFRIPITITLSSSYIIVRAVATGLGLAAHTIRLDVDSNCYSQYIYLTWKNPQGGFNYFLFTSNKDHNINILETQEREKNIFPTWEESYDENADSLSQETLRRSRREIVVRGENLTRDQVDMISGIKTSALVQQMTSKYNRRTVKVDTSGFTVRVDNEKLHTITFSIIYTDEIPSQSL